MLDWTINIINKTIQTPTVAECVKETIAGKEVEVYYLGYCSNGVNEISDPKFSICRVENPSGSMRKTWANGTTKQEFAFSDYASLNYSFLK